MLRYRTLMPVVEKRERADFRVPRSDHFNPGTEDSLTIVPA